MSVQEQSAEQEDVRAGLIDDAFIIYDRRNPAAWVAVETPADVER